jgi:hypothetical protein
LELSKKGKEGKSGRVEKKGERQQGSGRKTPASIQGQRVNLGKAAAVHHFLGCDSRELESNIQVPTF